MSKRSDSRWLWWVFGIGGLLIVAGLVLIRMEVTSTAVGTVRAHQQQILFAPRQARVETIRVQPGDRVTAGTVLLKLKDPSLVREQIALRERLMEVDRTLEEARLRAEELKITGGLPEALGAEDAERLYAERVEAYTTMQEMLAEAVSQGRVSQLKSLNAKVASISAELDRMENQRWIYLREAGLSDVYQKMAEVSIRGLEDLRGIVAEQLDHVSRERDLLAVRAPFDGVVSNVYARDPGMQVAGGEALVTISDPSDGYEVRAFVKDRNVDLIRPGLPVRMESHVYEASAEGYILGTVERIVTDPSTTERANRDGFEVVIGLDSYPVDPILGQRVTAKIIVEDAGPLDLVFRRSTRGEREPGGGETEGSK